MLNGCVGTLTGKRRVECQECHQNDAVKYVLNLFLCTDCVRDLAEEMLKGLPEPVVFVQPPQSVTVQ